MRSLGLSICCEVEKLRLIHLDETLFLEEDQYNLVIWLLGLLHIINDLDGLVQTTEIALRRCLLAIFVKLEVKVFGVEVISLIEDAALMLLLPDSHPIAPDEELP